MTTKKSKKEVAKEAKATEAKATEAKAAEAKAAEEAEGFEDNLELKKDHNHAGIVYKKGARISEIPELSLSNLIFMRSHDVI